MTVTWAQGYRNCVKCTRWRPVTDFRPRKWVDGVAIIVLDCNACHRQASREEYHKWPAARKKEQHERSRESHASKRREEGRPVAWPYRNSKRNGKTTLPAGPVLDLIRDLGLRDHVVAASADIDESVLRRARERGRIALHSADRICVGLKVPLLVIYSGEDHGHQEQALVREDDGSGEGANGNSRDAGSRDCGLRQPEGRGS